MEKETAKVGSMKKSRLGQNSIEYLLVVGVAIFVVAIVIFSLAETGAGGNNILNATFPQVQEAIQVLGSVFNITPENGGLVPQTTTSNIGGSTTGGTTSTGTSSSTGQNSTGTSNQNAVTSNGNPVPKSTSAVLENFCLSPGAVCALDCGKISDEVSCNSTNNYCKWAFNGAREVCTTGINQTNNDCASALFNATCESKSYCSWGQNVSCQSNCSALGQTDCLAAGDNCLLEDIGDGNYACFNKNTNDCANKDEKTCFQEKYCQLSDTKTTVCNAQKNQAACGVQNCLWLPLLANDECAGNNLQCSAFSQTNAASCTNIGCNYVPDQWAVCFSGSKNLTCDELGSKGQLSDITCARAGCKCNGGLCQSFSTGTNYDVQVTCTGTNNIICDQFAQDECGMVNSNFGDVCRPPGTCSGTPKQCNELATTEATCSPFSYAGCSWGKVIDEASFFVPEPLFKQGDKVYVAHATRGLPFSAGTPVPTNTGFDLYAGTKGILVQDKIIYSDGIIFGLLSFSNIPGVTENLWVDESALIRYGGSNLKGCINGCLLNNECVAYGTADNTNNTYCDPNTSTMEQLRSDDSSCYYNSSCSSGFCSPYGKCATESTLQNKQGNGKGLWIRFSKDTNANEVNMFVVSAGSGYKNGDFVSDLGKYLYLNVEAAGYLNGVKSFITFDGNLDEFFDGVLAKNLGRNLLINGNVKVYSCEDFSLTDVNGLVKNYYFCADNNWYDRESESIKTTAKLTGNENSALLINLSDKVIDAVFGNVSEYEISTNPFIVKSMPVYDSIKLLAQDLPVGPPNIPLTVTPTNVTSGATGEVPGGGRNVAEPAPLKIPLYAGQKATYHLSGKNTNYNKASFDAGGTTAALPIDAFPDGYDCGDPVDGCIGAEQYLAKYSPPSPCTLSIEKVTINDTINKEPDKVDMIKPFSIDYEVHAFGLCDSELNVNTIGQLDFYKSGKCNSGVCPDEEIKDAKMPPRQDSDPETVFNLHIDGYERYSLDPPYVKDVCNTTPAMRGEPAGLNTDHACYNKLAQQIKDYYAAWPNPADVPAELSAQSNIFINYLAYLATELWGGNIITISGKNGYDSQGRIAQGQDGPQTDWTAQIGTNSNNFSDHSALTGQPIGCSNSPSEAGLPAGQWKVCAGECKTHDNSGNLSAPQKCTIMESVTNWVFDGNASTAFDAYGDNYWSDKACSDELNLGDNRINSEAFMETLDYALYWFAKYSVDHDCEIPPVSANLSSIDSQNSSIANFADPPRTPTVCLVQQMKQEIAATHFSQIDVVLNDVSAQKAYNDLISGVAGKNAEKKAAEFLITQNHLPNLVNEGKRLTALLEDSQNKLAELEKLAKEVGDAVLSLGANPSDDSVVQTGKYAGKTYRELHSIFGKFILEGFKYRDIIRESKISKTFLTNTLKTFEDMGALQEGTHELISAKNAATTAIEANVLSGVVNAKPRSVCVPKGLTRASKLLFWAAVTGVAANTYAGNYKTAALDTGSIIADLTVVGTIPMAYVRAHTHDFTATSDELSLEGFLIKWNELAVDDFKAKYDPLFRGNVPKEYVPSAILSQINHNSMSVQNNWDQVTFEFIGK